MAEIMEDRQRPSLDSLMAEPSPQKDQAPTEAQQYLLRMKELARGLLGSEYWELVSLTLIEGLENAKAALESEATDDRTIRVRQGEANAYRSAYNKIIDLSKEASEEENG